MGLGLRRGRNIPGALGLSLTPPSQLYPHRHASHPQTSTRLRSPEAKLCSRGSLLIPQDPSQPITPLERKVKLIWSASWLFFFFYSQRPTFSVMWAPRTTPLTTKMFSRYTCFSSKPYEESQPVLKPSLRASAMTASLCTALRRNWDPSCESCSPRPGTTPEPCRCRRRPCRHVGVMARGSVPAAYSVWKDLYRVRL